MDEFPLNELEQAIKDFVIEQVPGNANLERQRVPDEKVKALAAAIRSEINDIVTDVLKRSGVWD